MGIRLLNLLYTGAAIWLAVYAFHALANVLLYLVCRRREQPPAPPVEYPPVLVQLPIYNEQHVVSRLVHSVARLRYPRQQLFIQVLDDSTDETTALAQNLVDTYRERGFHIELVHRTNRRGFKAGALREGLERAPAVEYVAIFDADFVPDPAFLHQTLPYLQQDAGLAFVQTRWGHLNADSSIITMAQSIALDGHFLVEQQARSRAGLFVGFNGSGGVWRREAILAAGNWHDDTLTEDLDLSYRAQLGGWRCRFIPVLGARAEIPPTVMALRLQQYRWAKGTSQCARKLWFRVAAARMPLWKRLQGLLHLTSYFIHPLMLTIILTIAPLMIARVSFFPILSVLGMASFAYPLLYVLAQRAQYDRWLPRLRYLLPLTFLGMGIALIVSKGVVEGLLGKPSEFVRTPKFGRKTRPARRQLSTCGLRPDRLMWGEAFLALYSLAAIGVAILTGYYLAVPFLLLYALGFAYVVAEQVGERVSSRPVRTAPLRAARLSARGLGRRR